MEISKRMKTRRTQLNLKAQDVAQRIGVAVSTYRDWENGRKIQGEPYQAIADVLEMSVLELLGIRNAGTSNLIFEVEVIERHLKNIRKSVM